MTTYTIVRNGTIEGVTKGDHYCGTRPQTYHYRVKLSVRGNLADAPDGFIVDNNAIDEHVQKLFTDKTGISCEQMAERIAQTVPTIIPKVWTVVHVQAAVTGTHGMAWLTCGYDPETVPTQYPEHDYTIYPEPQSGEYL